MEACCASLERPFGAAEEVLVAQLHANWYLTASDAAAMSEVPATRACHAQLAYGVLVAEHRACLA